MISRAARSAVPLRHQLRAITSTFVRTNRPCISRNCWSTSDASFTCGVPLKCFQELVVEIVPHATLICHPPRLPRVGRDGHHDGDVGSVLGTVQGSALRSDRASARPSGLDGACAQIIDSNYMMPVTSSLGPDRISLCGDNLTTLNAIACDAFFAGHPHSTRLLRSIFSIFAVDARRERRYSARIRWCCTHRPPRIGHRRGAAVDHRLQGGDQQLPGTSRKTIGDAHVDHLVGPRRRLLSEHDTRGPRAEAFTAWLVIVRTARPTAWCSRNAS